LHFHRQHGCHQGFTHSAFSAHIADHMVDTAHGMGFHANRLVSFAGCYKILHIAAIMIALINMS
jgi:hypothetical protein